MSNTCALIAAIAIIAILAGVEILAACLVNHRACRPRNREDKEHEDAL